MIVWNYYFYLPESILDKLQSGVHFRASAVFFLIQKTCSLLLLICIRKCITKLENWLSANSVNHSNTELFTFDMTPNQGCQTYGCVQSSPPDGFAKCRNCREAMIYLFILNKCIAVSALMMSSLLHRSGTAWKVKVLLLDPNNTCDSWRLLYLCIILAFLPSPKHSTCEGFNFVVWL